MKNSAFSAMFASVLALAGLALGQAVISPASAAHLDVLGNGAVQLDLDSNWANATLVDPPLGKVIVVQPGGRNKLNITWIIQGGDSYQDYTVGFDIIDEFGSGCGAPNPFGVARGGCGSSGPGWAFYVAGTVMTDADGDASHHATLKGL